MKSEVQPKQQMQAKLKPGSVLSAIEDIQRMSPEDIVQEFDRMADQTRRHFRDETFIPCVNVADELIRCLRHNKEQSCMCFNVMDEYRQCVGLATQAYVDRMAEDDERRLRAADELPVMPPQSVPSPPATMTNLKPAGVQEMVRRKQRSWVKPWTWLR
ncbi:uncharacterized protein LOC133848919 [Drosophila sulfurigaster albostrigata]|uniref:uncharacterized protein LOC133848919 n=1 Tax=Drosophila sulfurigaster albostrigata TaxID=89887 RepID=UPI002D21E191|nr:uncharacterized protein LOC133848919 [Drosophila sulfurigaster albostrigata]